MACYLVKHTDNSAQLSSPFEAFEAKIYIVSMYTLHPFM